MCKNEKKRKETTKCNCVIERIKRKKKQPIDKIFFRPESHLTNYSKSFGNLLKQSNFKKF